MVRWLAVGLVVIVVASVVASVVLIGGTGDSRAPGKPHVAAGLGRLPLSFERVPGGGFRALDIELRRGEAVLGPLRMRAGELGVPAGEGRLPGVVNRISGNDPARWRTGIPTFGGVRYSAVWPGIDLRFHGTRGALEYDLDVRPGADPGCIELQFSGQRSARMEDGDVVLDLGSGSVRLRRPVAYQGSALVPSRHVLLPDGRVRFQVGRYDHSRQLVIDPMIVYSTFIGGGDNDKGFGVAVGPARSVFVAGSSFTGSSTDAFVTRLNGDGNQVLYTTYVGGTAFDEARGIDVDSTGRAYVVGNTDSSNFPAASGVQMNSGGSRDAFVAQLDTSGVVQHASYHGGSGYEDGFAIALDGSANAYITGDTDSSNFPTVNARQAARAGSADAFVTKFNSTLTGRTYSTYHGGTGSGGNESGRGIVVDGGGGAIVTGFTDSSTFPLQNPVQAAGPTAFTDAFVSRFSNGGTSLTFSTYLGGGDTDQGSAIDLDSGGAIYIAGMTQSDSFPVANAPQGSRSGSADAFLTKLNSAGSAIIYSTYLGGGESDQASGVAIDSAGNAYVTGRSISHEWPFVRALRAERIGDFEDAFVLKFAPAGSPLVYSTFLGGSDYDRGNAIAVDDLGAAYVAGETQSPDFPAIGAVDSTLGSMSSPDAFVTKIDDSDTEPPDTIVTAGPPGSTGDRSAKFDFASSEPDGARFECRIDGAAFKTCTLPATYSELDPGTRKFEVRSTDRYQNVDPSPAAYSWRIDQTPPVAVLNGPTTAVAGTAAVFDAAGSSDPGEGRVVRYEFDFNADGTFEHDSGDHPRATNTFTAGDFKVGLRVSDEVGLTSTASTNLAVTHAPVKSAGSKVGAKGTKSRVTFSLKAAFNPPANVARGLVCSGDVRATLKAKNRRVTSKRLNLDKECRFSVKVRVLRSKLRRSKTVVITVHFNGNDYLGTADATYKGKVPPKKKLN